MYVRANMPGMPLGRGLRGLRSLRRLGCGTCGPKRLGQDSSIYDTQYGGGGAAAYESSAGGVINATDPQIAIDANANAAFRSAVASGQGSGLSPAQLTNLAITPGNMMPGVAPSTLLAAAALPNAPAAVVQAAAQYKAANPVSASLSGIFSGTTAGIPNVLLYGGVGFFAVLLISKKKR